MGPRTTVGTKLTAHRVAALASGALMRATNADMQEIIKRTRLVIEDSREAMRRVDAFLKSGRSE